MDNRNVLDSQSAAGDDKWEGEWAAPFLHDRSPLQHQEADLNSLLKDSGQEDYLRVSTAQYSAHQPNPGFSYSFWRERMTAPRCPVFAGLYLFRAKVTWAQTLSGLFLWVVWAQAVLWWNNCFSAICLKSHFQNLPVFPENHCWSAFEEGLASSFVCNSWDWRTFARALF